MKYLPFLSILFFVFSCNSKNAVTKSTDTQKTEATTTTDQQQVTLVTDLKEFVLNYEPGEHDGVIPRADYERGLLILGDVKQAFKEETQLAGDYWNLSMALIKLRGEKQKIESAFQKAITLDYVKTCAYCKQVSEHYPKTKALFQEQIPEVFNHTVEKCLALEKDGDPLKGGE